MDNDSVENVVQKINDAYSDNFVKESFELLLKLFGNILKNPTEEKFRVFKKSNEALKKKVLIIKENLELLKAIGYIDIDQEILAFNGNNFKNLETAKKLLEATVDNITNKELAKEDLEREQRAAETNEIIKKSMLKERENQKKIQEKLEADKLEMQQREKPIDSVANQLSFGMCEKKLEFKSSGGGGG